MKLKTSRNNRKKDDIANLLYGYHKRARKIALLRYELNCLEQVTHDELIEAMSYAHQDGIGRDRCHVSNKTPYIALNYRDQAERMNNETIVQITTQLIQLEWEQARLEYYVSLLETRQERVLRRTCFERAPQEKVAEELGVSVRRVQDIKAQAIDELAEMYSFAEKLH